MIHFFVQEEVKVNKQFFERTSVIIIALILLFPLGLFLMWRHQKFNESTRVLITCAILVLVGSWYTQETKVSRSLYDQDLASERAKFAALEADVKASEQELADAKEEVEALRAQAEADAKQAMAEAEEKAAQLVLDAETKAKAQVESAKKDAEQVSRDTIRDAKEEAAALIAKAEQEASSIKAAASASSASASTVAPATRKFQNCTDLRGTYPAGVSSDHPAYQPSMDRDKDGWACE